MIEGAEMKEVVDFINRSPGWEAWRYGSGEPSFVGERFDHIPVTCVCYNPFCDCGESALMELVSMGAGEMTSVGFRYMDTCYECSVVSSD